MATQTQETKSSVCSICHTNFVKNSGKKARCFISAIFNYIPLYDGVPDTWIMKISR